MSCPGVARKRAWSGCFGHRSQRWGSKRFTVLCCERSEITLLATLQVFMVASDMELDEQGVKKILATGHSRVPVHAPGNRSHSPPLAFLFPISKASSIGRQSPYLPK